MSRALCNLLLLCLFLILIVSAAALNAKLMRRAQQVTMKVGEVQLNVETAKTPLQIEKGLGGRASLKSDGMLFYLPQTSKSTFWMKGMQFALDFVWIEEGRVVDLTENVAAPAPNTPDAKLQTYSPKAAVSYVLEVPAGFVKQHNVKIDDSVILPK